MKILIKNHFENAFEALSTNRLRTFLTITGVTIGVAGITAILSLAGGAANFLQNQIVNSSESIALVRSGADFSTPDSLLADFQSVHTTTTLTEDDATDLAKITGATVAPMAVIHSSLKAKDGVVNSGHASIVSSSPDLESVADLTLLDGQFIDNRSSSGLVMGYQLAIDLFGTEYAIGNVVHIKDQTLTVVGVLKPIKQPVNYFGVDFDRSAIVPLSVGRKFTQNVSQIQQIAIASEQPDDLTSIIQQAEKILLENHGGDKDFSILSGKAITEPSSRLFSGISLTVGIIAAISLLVGGIGIMNIMLVNVAERNREVGIRKAIGATSGDIVSQFLIEASIIGLLSGLTGYVLGMGIAFVVGLYLPFTPVLEWQIAALAIGIAILTGIIFGIYPATHAAKKNPIEALYQ